MKRSSTTMRRGVCVFALFFALVTAFPFQMTAFAQKGRGVVSQSPDEIERKMKLDYQRSHPKKSKAPVSETARSAVGTNAAPNTTYSITFDAGDPIGGLTVGAVLGAQYQATTGAVFTANGFTGAGGPNGDWATNTDTTIVDSAGGDVGGLGTPALVSGNVLRSFNGWLAEDGDSSIRVTFDLPVSTFSATFCGIATAASTRVFAFDASNNLLTTSTAAGTGQQVVTVANATPIKSVVLTTGDFFDWVGVDNITFTTVNAGGPQNVNTQVSFTITTQGLTGIAGGCATLGYSGQYNINADLRNIGTTTINSPYFQLNTLRPTNGSVPSNPFRLKTADDFNNSICTGGLVGATQAVPGPIAPAQVVPVNLQVAIPVTQRFLFLFDVFDGAPGGGFTRNGKAVKLGQLAISVNGFGKDGTPLLSATFIPEKGVPTSFQPGPVNVSIAK